MAYLRLIRPLNCTMAAAGVAIAALVAVGLEGVSRHVLEVVLAAAAVFFVTAAGNVLNDYVDREADAVNHPDRPIPSGQVSPGDAFTLALILFVVPVPLGAFVNFEVLGLIVLNSILLVVYEREYKGRGLSGNLLISYLVASLFLYGGLAVAERQIDPLLRVALLGALAFVTTLAREITKDIEDMAGDVDRRTLPMRVGVPRAHAVAAGLLVAGVVLSAVPAVLGVLHLAYLAVVILADAMFITAARLVAERPRDAQGLEKSAMVVALMAFLVGGVL